MLIHLYSIRNRTGFYDLNVGDEVKLKKNNRTYTIVDITADNSVPFSEMLILDDGIEMIDVRENEIIRKKKE